MLNSIVDNHIPIVINIVPQKNIEVQEKPEYLSNETNLESIPSELIQLFLSFLKQNEQLDVRQTSKTFNENSKLLVERRESAKFQTKIDFDKFIRESHISYKINMLRRKGLRL